MNRQKEQHQHQQLQTELAALRLQVEEQQATINRLLALIEHGSSLTAAPATSGFAATSAPAQHHAISSPITPTPTTTTNQTRRTMLRRLATAVGGAALGTTLLTLPGGKEAQARTIINPKGVNGQVGSFITPPGAVSPTNAPIDPDPRYAVVAVGDTTAFDLSTLPTGIPCAVYGFVTSGAAVYGDNHDGYGIYGRSATSFGVVGNGYTATGVGVAGTTDSGIGMLAQATSGGVPFQIVAVGSAPNLPLQNLQPGMVWVDQDGNWWIWQKDSTNVYGWRKIQAV